MTAEFLDLAVNANRVLLYIGFVLVAGTLIFWGLVWREGYSDRRLMNLCTIGVVLMILASLVAPTMALALSGDSVTDVFSTVKTVALVVRLLALGATGVFVVTKVRAIAGLTAPVNPKATEPTTPALTHKLPGLLPIILVILISGTLVASSNAVGGPWAVAKLIATMGHVLATGAWLGGIVALGAVLIPREYLDELDVVIPRFSIVATVSATLLVTGTIHALAIAGGVGPLLDSTYGLVFVIKVVVFGGMLLLGNHGRAYGVRVAQRAASAESSKEMTGSKGVHALAVVMGAEITVAAVILAITSLLVMVAPTSRLPSRDGPRSESATTHRLPEPSTPIPE